MTDRSTFPIENYRLEAGSSLQRARLVKFMQRAYREMGHPSQDDRTGSHLANTVQRHLSPQSQIWWLIDEKAAASPAALPVALAAGLPGTQSLEPIGCLWMGEAVDQRSGLKQAYVFLLYVAATHRHQGLGTALMHHAQTWAKQKGYQHVSLQVFEDNVAAMGLYEKLGYQSQAKWMSLEI